MTYETLLLEKQEGVGVITLNRPDRLNAISSTLKRELDQALTLFEEDEEVRAVVVTGAGEKAFSAGADIHEMNRQQEAQPESNSAQPTDWIWRLAAYRKPTIGAINGLAYGGGALMASLLDIRFGCELTSFRFLGVIYSRINSSWTLPFIVGLPMAKELLFSGRVVEADEALSIGLLNRLVDSSELMKTAIELGKTIAANDAAAVQLMKDILIRDIGMGWQEMFLNETQTVSRSLKTPPVKESFKDFLKRKRG